MVQGRGGCESPRLIEASLQISLLNDEILTGKIDIANPSRETIFGECWNME
jgi:hypothetical protein